MAVKEVTSNAPALPLPLPFHASDGRRAFCQNHDLSDRINKKVTIYQIYFFFKNN
jgi:hypothetical protein